MSATPDVRRLNLAQFSVDSLLHGRAAAHFAQASAEGRPEIPPPNTPHNAVLITIQ